MIDVLFVHPPGSHGIFGVTGTTGDDLPAKEQPLWPRLIAGYLLDRGYTVKIVDLEVLRQPPEYILECLGYMKPRLVAIVAQGHQPSASTQSMPAARAIAQNIMDMEPDQGGKFRNYPQHRPVIVLLGNHASALPEQTLREEPVDFVIDGEGPTSIHDLLGAMALGGGIYQESILAKVPGLVWWAKPHSDAVEFVIARNLPAPLLDLDDELHGQAWHLLPPPSAYRAHNWQCLDGSPRSPYAAIYTSLGCPYTCHFCISGDTKVNTVYGDIPIDTLVGKEVPVFTFDITTKIGKVSLATNIRQYGVSELIRITFDDNSHLDLTPDHGVSLFNGKNKFWRQDAENLQANDRVAVLRIDNEPTPYPKIKFSGGGSKHIHRLVAEWMLGEGLPKGAVVHHMREAPTKGQKHWWTEPDGSTHLSVSPRSDQAIRGRKAGIWWTSVDRTTYQATTPRNTEDIQGRKGFNPHKNFGRPINHRVVSIEKLPGIHPVYCLDVPETGWFYANNILIKNCMINTFQHTNKYRMRSPEAVVDEIEMLFKDHGVRTFKVVDELFCLNRNHVRSICQLLIDRQFEEPINIWAYARTDTVHAEDLPLMRAAGIQWLALGIESGSANVRASVAKKLKHDNVVGNNGSGNEPIKAIIYRIHEAGINVIGNYIFGLPDDDLKSMKATLRLAQELNCEWANFYCAMAYPGSKLYNQAVAEGWTLPSDWRGYSQHNRYCRPLDTKHVDAATVLRFRDNAFRTYFSAPAYRAMITKKFGPQAVGQVEKMLEYKLERDLLK